MTSKDPVVRFLHAGAPPLPLRYVGDGLIITASTAWAYFSIPTVSYDFLAAGERIAMAEAVAKALASLQSADCHLLVLPRTYGVGAWRADVDGATPRPAPGLPGYLDHIEAHLAEKDLDRRVVMLGVCLGDRHPSGIRGLARRLEFAAGVGDDRVEDREVASWQARAGALARKLGPSSLGAELAGREDIAWAIRRHFWRGLEEPHWLPLHTGQGAELTALVEGTIINRRRHLEVGQGEATVCVAHLAIARFPEEMSFPGGEWLYRHSATWPLEASVRFTVVPPRQALKDARKTMAAASDQLRHVQSSSADPSLALGDTYQGMKQLEYAITRSNAPLVYSWPRLTVWAPTLDELEAVVTDVTEEYADYGIGLIRPTGGQLSLLLESLPGERPHLNAYQQRQGLMTLAGSMFHATAAVGDDRGPYLGTTAGVSRMAVLHDPLARALRNEPTAFAATGRPGGGKTTLALKIAVESRLRGAWTTFIDPKGDTNGMASLEMLGDDLQFLRLGPAYAGLLDPYMVASDPSTAELLAIDTLTGLLRSVSSDQEAAIERACRAASRDARPSLAAALRALGEDAEDVARRLGAQLERIARLPLAEMAFGDGAESTAMLGRDHGFTIIQLPGLNLPEEGVRTEDYQPSDRLALALVRLLVAYTYRLAASSAAQAKLIILDEAWAFTRSREGRALIQRLSRTGRSRNIALGLLTQNAGDLLDSTIKGTLTASFCFRADDSDEIRDVLALLQVEQSPAHIAAVRGLERGQCLYRDERGRVACVDVDLVLPEFLAAFDTTPGVHQPPAKTASALSTPPLRVV